MSMFSDSWRHRVIGDDGKLHALAWGSNRCVIHYFPLDVLLTLKRTIRLKVVAPELSSEQIRTPEAVAFLEGVALRDLALHAYHAACVDARGDVYQWGDGFFGVPSAGTDAGPRRPVKTLKGKVSIVYNVS